jgi:coronin-1B/1C/6
MTDCRSDGNIRYYEYENDKFEYLSEYKSADPQRGIAFLPKRGVNLHENEVLRCFKTVNDAYIEPISFVVPRRAEMFQSDIYPPTTGLKPGTTASEWFGGKTAAPPKISLESVYEGGAPEEVPSDYKPATASASPVATKTEAPKPEPAPAPALAPASAVSQGPPPSMNDNKASLANLASKFTDKEEEVSEDDTSDFEEISKPVERPTVAATRQEEKPRSPVLEKQPELPKPTPAPAATPAPATAPAPTSLPSSAPTPAATTTPSSAAGSVASGLKDFLADIKAKLEHQDRIMSDQTDQIALLVREVTTLKAMIGSQPSDREKDERIRELELELEEARS